MCVGGMCAVLLWHGNGSWKMYRYECRVFFFEGCKIGPNHGNLNSPPPPPPLQELKASLNNEFRLIHELCVFVLTNTRKVELIRGG